MRSKLEETLALHIRADKLPMPEREYLFHPVRKWRFDFAWPQLMLAVEVEGAVWTNGRHTRGSGFIADIDKYNEAVRLGWSVLRFHAKQVTDGIAVKMVSDFINDKQSNKEIKPCGSETCKFTV